MADSKASMPGSTLRTIVDVQLVLSEARYQAEIGNISGADEYVQQIKRLVQGEDAVEESLVAEMPQVRRLWLEALADLMPVLETQGAYKEALAYTRILHRDDPTYGPDLRRLIQLYVLSGSRAQALAAVQHRFSAVVQGQGSLVLIRGVAGIGKTSLAQICAALASRQHAIFAMGRCYEWGITSPFSPWQEVLTSLAEATGTSLDALPPPFGSGPPVHSADALIQTVATHLRHLEAEAPLVLLLDDLHWADQDTLDLLEYVTRRIENLPILILVTYRSEEIPQDHPLYAFLPTLQRDRSTEIIRLAALDLDDTTRLIEGHLGPCSPGLIRYLHDRAEGHPLFLIELLNDLEEQNLLPRDIHGRWLPPNRNVPVPTLLRQVIAQRVARLEHQGEAMLDVAAVIGETWELSIVEAILNWPEESLLAALENALAARLVETEDERSERYRFSHGLIQEVLYRDQLPRRRRNLHAQIAELLEAQYQQESSAVDANHSEVVSALAYHFYRAEQWPQAFQYSQQAGEAAHQRYALHSVVHFYRQALDAARQQGEVIAPNLLLNAYEKLGDAHYLLNQNEEDVDISTQMVKTARAAEDKAAEARSLFRLAYAQERIYAHDQSEKTQQAALKLAREVDEPDLRALDHMERGRYHMVVGNLDQAQHHLSEAERHVGASDNNRLLIDSLRYQGYVAIFRGEYREVERLIEIVFEHVKTTSNIPLFVNACWLQGFTLIELGHYERARQALLNGLEHVDTIGERHYYLTRLRNNLGYLYRELGDFEAAMHWNQLALAENRKGDSFHAHECAYYSLLDLATNQLEAGQIEAAQDYFRKFEAVYNLADRAWFRYFNRALLLQVELALAQGKFDSALDYAVEATELARAKTVSKNVTKGLLYQGQALLGLHRPTEAVTYLEQAVALADQLGHIALQWKTRLRLAEVYTVLNRPNKTLYDEALAIVNNIANNLHNPQLHTSFINLPLVVALRARTKPSSKTPKVAQSPAGLTPREIEVLRLVAQGYTDRQISEQLHITVRTVNTHVTNILNKTGCENRTAAATFAAQNNLV